MTADILVKGLANYFKRINGEATELDGLIRSLKTTDTSRVGERGKIVKIHELVEGVEYMSYLNKYTTSNGRLMYYSFALGEWQESDLKYNITILMEFTECEFEPKQDETYYFPVFDYGENYECYSWDGNEVDYRIKRVVGIYRTKEQAIEKARELGWVE